MSECDLACRLDSPFDSKPNSETPGIHLDKSERAPEAIVARFAKISDPATAEPLKDAFGQTMKFVAAAAKAKGVKLG